MRLMRDRIIVQQDETREDITTAGIIVKASQGIQTSREQLGRRGTVLAIGPEVDADQLPVGSRVLYGEFDYPQATYEGRRCLLMQDADICGVIE